MIDTVTPNKQSYTLETVAQFVEWIIADIARHPERCSELTTHDRALWAGFPAQIRAHRCPYIFIDPDRSIFEFLMSGHIGPNFP